MSSDARQVKRLQDYTPPAFLAERIHLHVALFEDHARIHARTTLRRNPAAGAVASPLILDGKELELLTLEVNGTPLPASAYALEPEQLVIAPDHLPPGETSFVLGVETRIKPQENTSLEGLYRSKGLFCTQCEAEGFRKITFYLDRPDVMARFTTTVEADQATCPVLLSNGNPVARGALPEGRHFVTWEDPFPKPCYLFALVAGNLLCHEEGFTTMSGREVALRLYVEPENISRCAHAATSLKKAMAWDEARFGREYDLEIYMIVSVNDFNMGAMENKGLNIFNAKYALADPETATDADFMAVENVIAHEYFHNWTGNRITCRDWFQLSLKEGLTVFRDQLFSGESNSLVVQRIEDVRMLRASQFPEDAGPTAHPVQPEAYIEINNFYTATVYDKGAEVVRMLHTLLGDEGFRRGMDLYFQRHDGQAVTVEEFVRAMEAANGREFAQFRRWYTQAGTPRLQATWSHDPATATFRLTLRQGCPPTPGQPHKRPFHMPVGVGLLDARDGHSLPLRLEGESAPAGTHRILELRQEEETFCFVNVPEPPIPSLLRNFSAPVRLESALTETELAFLWSRDEDAFNRWEAGQTLAMRLIREGVARHLAGEEVTLAPWFREAFAVALGDDQADPELTALALTLPGESTLMDQLAPVDPLAVHQVRQTLRRQLAGALREALWTTCQAHRSGEPYRYDPKKSGPRSLKNLCLDYLVLLEEPEVAELAWTQYRQADNMTDRLRALTALVHGGAAQGEEALGDFHRRWRHHALVVDKWLAIQATAPLPHTLERVRGLLGHADFSLGNPNKVRALIGSFCAGNSPGFHAESGAGYDFLAEQVTAIDPANPQLAARLVMPLTRWRACDAPRGERMRVRLAAILAHRETLSPDLYEMVSKSLA